MQYLQNEQEKNEMAYNNGTTFDGNVGKSFVPNSSERYPQYQRKFEEPPNNPNINF